MRTNDTMSRMRFISDLYRPLFTNAFYIPKITILQIVIDMTSSRIANQLKVELIINHTFYSRSTCLSNL